jgi:hypothetical protein
MKKMTDDNPTELETFQTMEEAAKILKLAINPEYSKFMILGLTAGKSATICQKEWDDAHKPAEMTAEMKEYTAFMEKTMKEGKTLLQAVEAWATVHKPKEEANADTPGVPEELKPVMSRLEALEKAKLEEVKVQLAAAVAEVKKVDPTFDEKKFLAPFGENVGASIMAINVYMETVKHLKETLPEIQTQMHIGEQDSIAAHRKELTKKMFGTEDISKVIKEL